MTRLRVLIIGGYGTFGGRLARLLADEARLTLVIAGRSRDKAQAFRAALPARATTEAKTGATTEARVFDRNGDVEAQLRAAAPDILVDATGPFQSYGDDPYQVVKACLALGIDYLDLADGSAFVAGIGPFDGAARARGIFVLSGASSFPVLTAAVVGHLARGLERVESIAGGIAPSPYAGVGLNVISAIAGYAGQPLRLRRDGQAATGHALTESRRYTIAPPGRLPLRNIRFSLVDVPDLRVLAAIWPDARSIWMGAGTLPEILQRCLNALAWLVRLRALPSLGFLAPLFFRAINLIRWGEHRGGMFVRVEGRGAGGVPVERSWHLLAEGDDGPLIPAMAVEAIVRNCLEGKRPDSGARSAAQELTLADYEARFAGKTIQSGTREVTADGAKAPLYRRVLGDAWERLPAPIRTMHSVEGELTAEGLATVDRGGGLLARLIGALVGFPRAGDEIPVTVTFTVKDGVEHWRRTFAGKSFVSTQRQGRGRSAWLVEEGFGPLSFGLALVLEGDRLRLVLRRWRFLGLPLPLALAPTAESFETVEVVDAAGAGRFRFHVEIGHRLTGLIVRYRGWLVPIAPG